MTTPFENRTMMTIKVGDRVTWRKFREDEPSVVAVRLGPFEVVEVDAATATAVIDFGGGEGIRRRVRLADIEPEAPRQDR
jgi:hypothetical protein